MKQAALHLKPMQTTNICSKSCRTKLIDQDDRPALVGRRRLCGVEDRRGHKDHQLPQQLAGYLRRLSSLLTRKNPPGNRAAVPGEASSLVLVAHWNSMCAFSGLEKRCALVALLGQLVSIIHSSCGMNFERDCLVTTALPQHLSLVAWRSQTRVPLG